MISHVPILDTVLSDLIINFLWHCDKPQTIAAIALGVQPDPEATPSYTETLWACRILEHNGFVTACESPKSMGMVPMFELTDRE